ncbi:hypothetical protein GCM10017714_10680 [Curtobacterium pusillum]|nr:hypothetical protein GCM10017610_06130 [Curtobacterium pusillum]
MHALPVLQFGVLCPLGYGNHQLDAIRGTRQQVNQRSSRIIEQQPVSADMDEGVG